MAKSTEAASLKQVANEPNPPVVPATSSSSFLSRVSSKAIGIVVAAASVYVLTAFGAPIPGRGYVRSVLSDPWVFTFARLFFIALFGAGIALAVWFTFSVVAYIRAHLWIRRPAGLEPQAIHRAAGEIEAGVEDLKLVIAETQDTNAELLAALVRANERVEELELQLGAAGEQLSLGNGS